MGSLLISDNHPNPDVLWRYPPGWANDPCHVFSSDQHGEDIPHPVDQSGADATRIVVFHETP
jgi:hypothetical protein